MAGQAKTVTLDTESITGLNPSFDLFGGGQITAVGDLDATVTVTPLRLDCRPSHFLQPVLPRWDDE